ncbi:iron-sulfur cluster co-chaperone protein HscB, mitochondrial-like [Ctenocephalides felis]|uniref:iron-sulfur cluster co-chaperone protein HscB, mitochondrial-like n=1 Tax=Ctenocephalides felis TaxID=7515 RepID=UPI000E6E4176|nr:iron-sulfur cluster co-chaperone protein HscB, mitochondrial-like [Ctenocephalides felis]
MFCEHCKTLREPDKSDNYFNILDLEKKYTIDKESLSQKFKSLQKLLHPDKFTNRSEKEQELSLEWSSRVNKAYSTMNHPIDRAEYLLQDVGVSLSEESESKDTEFLMEMMERNEEIAEISTAKQAAESLKKIQATVQELGLELGKYIESKDYENAIKIFARMKYFYSVENNLRTKAASLTGTIES